MSENISSRKYSFIPAAVNSLSKYGVGIYIKYAKNYTNKIIIKEDNFKYTWLICPDRELILVKNNHPLFYPMGENFDEFVDLNVLDDTVADELDIDIYMLNYSAYGPTSTGSPRGRRSGRNPKMKRQPHILADSGGFQLFSGIKTYIDPKEVVEWYNDNADWGMVLDVPPVKGSPQSFLTRSAVIQKENIRVMLENKKESLDLINVLQGPTFEQRMDFMKIVDHPDVNRLAFPAYSNSTLVDTTSVLQVLSMPRKFKHYHILGVYNLLKLAPIIKIANTPALAGSALITSDASTPIQSAVNKIYHHQQTMFEPAKRVIIGNRENIANVNSFLPCSCPVCSSIKYLAVLGVLDSQLISNILSVHNIYEVKRFTNMLNELASTLDDKEYKTVIRHQLKSRGSDTLIALDLVSQFAKDPQAAMKRYSMYFTKKKSGLYDNTHLYVEKEDVGLPVEEAQRGLFISSKIETKEERIARFEATLNGYEVSHGITLDTNGLPTCLSGGKLVKKKKKKHYLPTEVTLSTENKKKQKK